MCASYSKVSTVLNKLQDAGTKHLISLHNNLISCPILPIPVYTTVRISNIQHPYKVEAILGIFVDDGLFAPQMQKSLKIFYNTLTKYSRSQEVTWDIT